MRDKEKFKILIVDDESSDIDVLTHILKPKHSVFVAKDGKSAIEIAHKIIPDLILLDIVMPGMSGFDTLISLKDSDFTRGIPVIFITGRDNVKDEERGFALGAVDYITKPFYNSIVEARVRNHLQMTAYIRMIERLCMIDALTNLPNRRYFDSRINVEWERAARESLPISIMLLDVDGFKAYNDAYGHSQGDVMLCAIASSLEDAMDSSTGFAARWGGDEFAVLLPDTGLDKALELARLICSSVERAVISLPDGNFTTITVSIGVNSAIPAAETPLESFITTADKALYAAKESGRNAVMHLDAFALV